MKSVKRLAVIFAAVLLTLSMALGIAACGGGGGTGGTKEGNVITVLYEGFVNGAVPTDHENNPYKKVIDEKYGVDYQLSVTSDLNTEIMKRYSSSNAVKPDIVVFGDYNQLRTLYDQGWYIDDYTPYLEYMPKLKTFFDEEENRRAVASIYEGDALTCLMYPNEGADWQFRIRKDWVAQWNEAKGTSGNPKTVDELLDMARWVKQSKGEGYYLFTSAGGLKSLGYIAEFMYMFTEHSSWYVDDTGKINHPYLDGSHEKYLNFLRTIVSEGLIDPSWYTQDWAAHKTNLYAGKIGIDYYTPVLAVEYMEGNGGQEAGNSGIWTSLSMPTADGLVRKGHPEYSRIGFKFAIGKENEGNPERMEKICRIINDMMYEETDDIESSLYYQLRWGITIDNYTLTATDKENEFERVLDEEGNDTGYYAFYTTVNREGHKRTNYGSLWDYGKPIQWGDHVIEYGKSASYGQSAYDFIEMFEQSQAYYGQQTLVNYADVVSLPSRIVTRTQSTVDEFEINYIKGTTRDTYADFVSKWLQSGASSLQTTAEQQLRTLGYIQ